MRVASVALLVAFVPSVALAEETFQGDVAVAATRFKADTQRSDFVGLGGNWFFAPLPVEPKDYPLNEVAFVERVGFVNAAYSWISSDIDNEQRLSNGSSFNATARLRQPGSPWVATVSAGVADSGKFRGSSSDNRTKTTFYTLDLGAYVAKATTLSLAWSQSKADFTASGPAPSTSTDTFTALGVSGRHLAYLPNGEHVAITAAISQIRHEQPAAPTAKNNDFSLVAIYYPSKTLGLTLGASTNRGDDSFNEGETYIAGAQKFFTPLLSVVLTYQHFDAKAANGDNNIVNLQAALRF